MGRTLQPAREKTTLLIADQTPMACELLGGLLSRPKYRIRVVAYTIDAASTLEAVAKHRPQVALVSASLSEGARSGFQLIRQLRTHHPDTRAILLADTSDRELVVEAFRNGAAGVFSRTEPMSRLWKSIRSVDQGQVWANSQELQFLLEELASGVPIQPTNMLRGAVSLTDREEQVVLLVAEGLTNREVAAKLGLSEHTIKNYVFRVFDKLGVSTRVELTRYALSQHPASVTSPGSHPAARPEARKAAG